MIISIHQPNFMPWLGFFDKIAKSDVFVILDDSQFQKNVFLNRNKIKTANGAQWLTVPVQGGIHKKINEILIDNTKNWKKDHLRTLELAYKKSKNFSKVFPEIKEIYDRQIWNKMIDLNLAVIYWMIDVLNIRGQKIILSSNLKVRGKGSEMLLDIVAQINGDTYLSGSMGKDYLDESIFRSNGIKIIYQDFKEQEYKQCWGDFTSNLSAVDYIFNV